MIVIFISECEKAATKKTRQILDNFALRIGSNTWKTRITLEGLKSVKLLLSKYATKQTAVACHRIAGRNSTELLWVVGNKLKFNHQGIRATNYTRLDKLQNVENSWFLLPFIKTTTALAALLHDLGKASDGFQKKLKNNEMTSDALRHDWISCLLFKKIVGSAKTDGEWLTRVANDDLNLTIKPDTALDYNIKVLKNLPPLATMVMWLILAHHRLPLEYDKNNLNNHKENNCNITDILEYINHTLGYENKERDKQGFLTFSNGLPTKNKTWIKELKKWCSRANSKEEDFKTIYSNGLFRIVLHFSLICLKLGDHYFSSQKSLNIKENNKNTEQKLYANTNNDSTEKYNQLLDEHLIGVMKQALNLAHMLPQFELDMPLTSNTKSLRRKSPKAYGWQDKAVNEILKWRTNLNIQQNGFFAINMASTGCGKTIANAKIMRALSEDKASLRYILALGLRTLTLQSGEVYRKEIGLTSSDVAVMIGSSAIRDLFELKQKEETEDIHSNFSESSKDIMEEFLDYDCDIYDEKLKTVLQTQKHRDLLYAPILICTIDHIIQATESVRGGKGLLANIRLMSSDLVIDEIDDFGGEDLIAISRLIFLVGMLGKKVMLSSATIQPSLAQSLFYAYSCGYRIYAKSKNINPNIGSAWIDEYKTTIENFCISDKIEDEEILKAYEKSHEKFTANKVRKIKDAIIKCKGYIAKLNLETEENYHTHFFQTIKNNILSLHKYNYENDPETHKNVSWGVVRMANINPCIQVGCHLMESPWDSDTEVRIMIYHSQQILLLRHIIEKNLDKVLKRKDEKKIFKEPSIRKILDATEAKNVIFIVVATPIEEIGRDHDFNWAIIEPSSYRSIIQMAGRVRRHRTTAATNKNIAVLQYNFKGFEYAVKKMDRKAFIRPGYEDEMPLNSHDLKALLDESILADGINSIPRITCKDVDNLKPKDSLIDLEHYYTLNKLANYKKVTPSTPLGWTLGEWWLTGFCQGLAKFRRGIKSETLYLLPKNSSDEDTKFEFHEKVSQNEFTRCGKTFGITVVNPELNENRLWLSLDYYRLLIEHSKNGFIDNAAKTYGFLDILRYNENEKFEYSYIFGLIRK